MPEYIIEMGKALYDPDTGAAVFKPEFRGELIRCRECKYRDVDDFCTGRGYPNGLVPDDGFCDKGKRRD